MGYWNSPRHSISPTKTVIKHSICLLTTRLRVLMWSCYTAYLSSSRNSFNSSPLGKMAAISQTIFFRCIFVNEKFCLLIKISLNSFPEAQLTINRHKFRYGLALSRRQAIVWTNVDLVHWRIYATLRGDELWRTVYPGVNFTRKMDRMYWYKNDDKMRMLSWNMF